jgi:hypothetical protein
LLADDEEFAAGVAVAALFRDLMPCRPWRRLCDMDTSMCVGVVRGEDSRRTQMSRFGEDVFSIEPNLNARV